VLDQFRYIFNLKKGGISLERYWIISHRLCFTYWEKSCTFW